MHPRTTNFLAQGDAEPAAWYAAADADVPVATQWDDGRHQGTAPGTVPTSSASMPSVVMAMLADLDVRDVSRPSNPAWSPFVSGSTIWLCSSRPRSTPL